MVFGMFHRSIFFLKSQLLNSRVRSYRFNIYLVRVQVQVCFWYLVL